MQVLVREIVDVAHYNKMSSLPPFCIQRCADCGNSSESRGGLVEAVTSLPLSVWTIRFAT